MYYFYELSIRPLELIAPKIVEKLYLQGERCLIYQSDLNVIKQLDDKLWTFGKNSFIPHSSVLQKDLDPKDHPVHISNSFVNENQATCLVFLNHFEEVVIPKIDKYYYIFEMDQINNNDLNLLKTRLSTQNRTIIYWKESPDGGWVKI